MIVLDASALVDAVAKRPGGPDVLSVIADEAVIAPPHQLAEVLSALTRMGRAGQLESHEVRMASDLAAAFDQEVIPLTAAQMRRAIDLQGHIRVLDGLYVALAERRGCPLVTTDTHLVRAAPPCELIIPPPA